MQARAPACLLAVLLCAACGHEGTSAEVEKAIEADWEGAAIAQPPVEWPERYAMLSGSELESISCSDIAADTRDLDCVAEVSGGEGGFAGRVAIRAELGDAGQLARWDIESVEAG